MRGFFFEGRGGRGENEEVELAEVVAVEASRSRVVFDKGRW